MGETVRGTILVARREIAAYFNTLWGYVVVATLLLADGLLFNVYALGPTPKLSSQVLEAFFQFSSGVTMIAAVLLTMRLFAEERQTGTIVLLESAPLPEGAVAFGKYLSALVFLCLMVAITIYMPALIFLVGKVSFGHIFAGYLGLVLLASASVALGGLASSLSKNQVVAGVLGGLFVVVLLLMWLLARETEPPFKSVFEYMSLWDRHFRPFMGGRIETESIVYYLSVTALALFGTTRVLAWRRNR